MKRIISIFFLALATVVAIANDSFDPTKNYQFNNFDAYLGEILEVKYFDPVPEGYSKWDQAANPDRPVAYDNFYDYYNLDVDDPRECLGFLYHFEGTWLFHYKGTRRDWLVGKAFKVVAIHRIKYYTHRCYFELVNIKDPNDKCYYKYYGGYEMDKNSYEYLYNDFNNFPFIVRKHRLWKEANGK